MKLRIILSGPGGKLDEQTVETQSNGTVSANIIQALKAWELDVGDTIKIEEVEE